MIELIVIGGWLFVLAISAASGFYGLYREALRGLDCALRAATIYRTQVEAAS